MYDPDKGYPVTPCMDVYKENIPSDGSLDKLKSIIVVIGDLQNKKIIWDTWAPTYSMRNMKYFLEDAANNKAIVHQLDFIGIFIKENAKHKLFVKFSSRYGEYFPDHAKYFGRPLRLNK